MRVLAIPRSVIPAEITPEELRGVGAVELHRTPTQVYVLVRGIPTKRRGEWRRWKKLGVRVLASSWKELRDQLTEAQRKRLFRAKVVRTVDGKPRVGYVLEKDLLETDRVLSTGRPWRRIG